jgi:hypothetical protein
VLSSTIDPGATVALFAGHNAVAHLALRHDRQAAFRAVARVDRELRCLKTAVRLDPADKVPEQHCLGRPVVEIVRRDDLAVGIDDDLSAARPRGVNQGEKSRG